MREGSLYVSEKLHAGKYPYEIYKGEGDKWLLLWKCRKPSPEKNPQCKNPYAYTVAWKVEQVNGEVVEQYRRHDGLIVPVMTVIAVDENGESKRWIQVTNTVTKVANPVAVGDDKDDVSVTINGNIVTFSKDDPLFGDFAEKTEKGDRNFVTVTKLSPISSPIQTTGNEELVKKGDEVTEISYLYTRENNNNNIYRELEKPVTFRHPSPGVIKTHKVDENGNIVLEE